MRNSQNNVPVVSVILTTYNRPMFLPEAIDSILNQTLRELDLIIVDDGSSTPETEIICKRYVAADDRVKYVRQNNAGLSAARNRGVSESASEFVTFLDDDDIKLPECIEKQIEFLREHSHVVAVVCESTNMDVSGKILRKIPPLQLPLIQEINPALDSATMRHREFLLAGSVPVYRRNIYLEMGGFDERFWCMEDWEFTLRMEEKHPIAKMPGYLHLGRVHGEGNLQKHPQTWQYFYAAYVCAYLRRNNMSADIPADILSTDMFKYLDDLGERAVKFIFRKARGVAKMLMRTGQLTDLQGLLADFNAIYHARHHRQFKSAMYFRLLVWAVYYGKLRALPLVIKNGINAC